MPFIVPDMTTRLLRGEMPEIVEVPHDPTRGWLEPEFEYVGDAALAMCEYVIGILAVYRGSPFREKQETLYDTLYDLWYEETPSEEPF